MEIVTVTPENLAQEHICCAISSDNDCQAACKKAWLAARFADGLVFKKGNVRGKCFIEYIPAEQAWAPIDASGYTYIDCLWVSGQWKGQGHSSLLLSECIRDSQAQGKKGLCLLSSQKKKLPFLADPKYLAYKGFAVADTADPYFALMYLPFDTSATPPRFQACAKRPQVDASGFALYYADQCPYTAKYVPLLQTVAAARGVTLETIHLQSAVQAQSAPTPFTSFSLFYGGRFVTHEILSEQKFSKIIDEYAK